MIVFSSPCDSPHSKDLHYLEFCYQCGLIKQVFCSVNLTQTTWSIRHNIGHMFIKNQIMPRFFAECDGLICFPSTVMAKLFGTFANICGVRGDRSFVLSGLIERLLVQSPRSHFSQVLGQMGCGYISFLDRVGQIKLGIINIDFQ